MKYLKSLILGMLFGLVTGPFLMCLLTVLYTAATDYPGLRGEDLPWTVAGIMSIIYLSAPLHLLLGGMIGLLSHRLNRLFCMLIGGAYGAMAGYLTCRWVDIERLYHGESAYLVLLVLSATIIAGLVKNIALSKIPIDWDVDLSGDTRSKYLPD